MAIEFQAESEIEDVSLVVDSMLPREHLQIF